MGRRDGVVAEPHRSCAPGQRTTRAEQILRRVLLATLGVYVPTRPELVEMYRCHPGFELDIPQRVETVHDMVEVGEDLRLRGETLASRPLALELFVNGVRVVDALDRAACTGILVEVPRTVDTRTGFVAQDLHAGCGQRVHCV